MNWSTKAKSSAQFAVHAFFLCAYMTLLASTWVITQSLALLFRTPRANQLMANINTRIFALLEDLVASLCLQNSLDLKEKVLDAQKKPIESLQVEEMPAGEEKCQEDVLTNSSSTGKEPAPKKRPVRMDVFEEFFQCDDGSTWTEELPGKEKCPLIHSSSIGEEPASEKSSVRMDTFMEFFQCDDGTTWTEEITCALCSDKGKKELLACSSPGSCHDERRGSFVHVPFLADEKQPRTKKGGNTDQVQESTEAKGDGALSLNRDHENTFKQGNVLDS